eukprot:TRINITY_DN17653_c0_g1_i1.p1 TRINITY_DN17653_c0_g1~~TRINITY_DN17653_c0_g1_i1.p1  ORF type:complete len:202 (+),score=18.81 TRINITY_DN17653_c0_g1_i1:3-608(+)
MADEEAKKVLERKLHSRPDSAELVARNVLKEGTPRLQAAAVSLKKEQTLQSLEQKVGARPDRDQLEQKNIIKPGDVAPALQAAQEALKREKLQQSLAHKLEHRPDPKALVDQNVLKQGAPRSRRPKRPLPARSWLSTWRRASPPALTRRILYRRISSRAHRWPLPCRQPGWSWRKEKLLDTLTHKIESRPPQEELQEKGLL